MKNITCKRIKLIFTVLMIVIALTSVLSTCFAESIIDDPGSLRPNPTAPVQAKGAIERVLGAIQIVGIIASVVLLVVIGILYMLGSTEEKVDYKKSMIPYLIGVVLIAAASSIANFVYKLANHASN